MYQLISNLKRYFQLGWVSGHIICRVPRYLVHSTSLVATRCQKCTECVTFLMLHMLRVYWSAWFLRPQISNSIYIWTNYFWDVMFAVQVLQHYLSLTSLPAPIVLILLFNLIRYVLHHTEQNNKIHCILSRYGK